ncbi:MAG: DUF559 domain-containing protein [Candidatus Zambryskibacteria bacterium]|nr:DUF559 domain-containing protein [Candidatus Zambryskibacteria bacterium]
MQKGYDATRDKYFKELGYKTIRIKNENIQTDLMKVIEQIKKTLSLRLGEGASSLSRSG